MRCDAKYKLRVQAIDAAIREREDNKAAHAPWVLIQPWDMINDQYDVYFYPEGKFSKPVKHEKNSFADVCQLIGTIPDDMWCQLSMGSCIEWLFAFHIKNERGLYTEEQIDRLTKDDIEKYPDLESLLTTEDGKKMMEILSNLPQVAMIQMGNLKKALLR